VSQIHFNDLAVKVGIFLFLVALAIAPQAVTHAVAWLAGMISIAYIAIGASLALVLGALKLAAHRWFDIYDLGAFFWIALGWPAILRSIFGDYPEESNENHL